MKNMDKILDEISKEKGSVHFKLNNKEVFDVKIKGKEILVDIKDFAYLLKNPKLVKLALNLKSSFSSNYKIKIKKNVFRNIFSKK